MEEKFLWKFHWDCGRQGDVIGLFVARKQEIEDAIGEEVYFGEILGKHSEVFGIFELEDVEILDLDSETVEKVSKLLGETWSGYNPLHYLRHECTQCGDTYSEEEMEFIDGKWICDYCKEE